jgi:hypothetical protein
MHSEVSADARSKGALATPDRNVFYTSVATIEDVCDGFASDKD